MTREERIKKYVDEYLDETLYARFGWEIPFTEVFYAREFAIRRVDQEDINEHNSKCEDFRDWLFLYPRYYQLPRII